MQTLNNLIFRRKKKFINPKTQISIALWLVIHSLLFFLLMIVVMFVPPVANWLNPGIDYRDLWSNFFALLWAKWPFMIVILAIVIIHGNFFSHKVVGPAYRFKNVLAGLANKDLTVFLKLRKFDYHKDVEQSFREYINALKHSVKTLRDNIAEADTALKSGDASKAKNAINMAKQEIDKYKIE